MAEQPARPKRPANLPASEPWKPADWTDADAQAIKAVASGAATPEQQIRAFKFFVNDLCDVYGLSFRPGAADGDRATAFAEGKRWPGLQAIKLLNINLNALRKANGRPESEQP